MNNNVLRNISYGVYVISTLDESRATGCIANSVIQVTQNTVAISINHNNFTNQCIKNSKKFAISILGENCDENIIPVFGFQTSKDTDKFKNFETETINGLSIIKNSIGYIICDLKNCFETETHTIFLGKIIDGDILNTGNVMTYAYYHKVKKGTSPKNAPTYIKEESANSNEIAYRCSICGYIHNGDLTKEPDSFVCPVCKQPKSVFEIITT